MNGKIKFNDLTNVYEKLNMEMDKTSFDLKMPPYGFICSENTKTLLEKHCEDDSNQYISNSTIIYGLKIITIKYFPDDTIWLLNEMLFRDVEKNGLASLIKRIAKLNNVELWGLND